MARVALPCATPPPPPPLALAGTPMNSASMSSTSNDQSRAPFLLGTGVAPDGGLLIFDLSPWKNALDKFLKTILDFLNKCI